MSNKKELFPSEKIGVEEEFLASEGTYIENGEVKSSVFGKMYINKERYRANVIPFQGRNLKPKRYDTVIGEVIKVNRSSVRLNIYYLNDKPRSPFSAIMHISDSSREYVNSLDELYCASDLIRATVIDAKSFPIQLESKANNTGVIHTICEKCGESVKKIRINLLQCVECEHFQKRKTSIDFGTTTLISEY